NGGGDDRAGRDPKAPGLPGPTPAPDTEPFPVAEAHEVEILSVEGRDTGTVVVGHLPVDGPLVLATPGEVSVTSVEPPRQDQMVPGGYRGRSDAPMIWARVEGEAGVDP